MKQQDFENRYQHQWKTFEYLLTAMQDRKAGAADYAQFTALYRRVCQLSALCKERQYSPYLVDHLNNLVLLGHQRLYAKKGNFIFNIIQFVVIEFPTIIRSQQKFVWLAMVLLFAPTIAMGLIVYFNSELIFSVIDPQQVSEIESMYDPAMKVIGRTRESDTDILMFGFYIKNNIGIGFQTFAGGILLGLGSIFFLVYNGISIGAIAGHLTQLGYTDTFYPFVCGHSAFELTAIAIFGAAGLQLGWSIIVPGQLTRLDSLRAAASTAVKLVYGVILMLTIAAFLEAFWSSNTVVPISVKYAAAGIFWVIVVSYFVFSGRRNKTSHGSGQSQWT